MVLSNDFAAGPSTYCRNILPRLRRRGSRSQDPTFERSVALQCEKKLASRDYLKAIKDEFRLSSLGGKWEKRDAKIYKISARLQQQKEMFGHPPALDIPNSTEGGAFFIMI